MSHRPVHWHEGMFLRPHHFQAQQRHADAAALTQSSWDCHHYWGVRYLEWDAAALANSRLVVRRLAARLRDGTSVRVPEDCELNSVDLAAALAAAPRGEFAVLLALPRVGLGRTNVADGRADGRFRVDEVRLDDENAGGNEQPLLVRRLNARLIVSGDPDGGLETLPLLRLGRSAAGSAQPLDVDREYIPPLLGCDGFAALQNDILQDTYHQIGRRVELLAEVAERRGLTLDSQGEGNAQLVSQLGRLVEASALFSNLAFVPGVHPLTAYLELCRLVGQLAPFAEAIRAPELPRYDHDDLGGCFWKLKRLIDEMLNRVREPGYRERAFVGAGKQMRVTMDPAWLGTGWGMFIGVGCELSSDVVRNLLTRGGRLDMKVGASDRVDGVFARGQEGLRFTAAPTTPPGLPARPGLTFLQIANTAAQDEWTFVQRSQSLAVRFKEEIIAGNIHEERVLKINYGGQKYDLTFTLYMVPPAG